MLKSRKWKNLLWIIIVFIVVGLAWLEVETHFIEEGVLSVFYDNRKPVLHCDELPALADVERIMAEHQEIIQQIEGVDTGFVTVSIDSSCPGKGSLLIEYPSHADREQIEALLGDTFFGVPYTGVNY